MKFNNLHQVLGWFLNRKQQAIALVVLVMVFIGGIFYFSAHFNGSKSYDKTLLKLKRDVQGLQRFTNVPELHEIDKDLSAYADHLEAIKQSCHDLSDYKQKNNQDTATKAKRLDGLCGDLENVVDYNKSLYAAVKPYLLLDSSEWPTEQNIFAKRLQEVEDTSTQTLIRLNNIDNNVEDPALDELITQVKSTLELQSQIKTANDSEILAVQTEELRKQLETDKTDFMAARSYFWNNTIDLNKLNKALEEI